MDFLSLVIDILKWVSKKLSAIFGYQMDEFEQIICAVLLFSLTVMLAGIFLRYFFFT